MTRDRQLVQHHDVYAEMKAADPKYCTGRIMAIKKGVNHSNNKKRCSAGNLDNLLWKCCKSRYADLSCSDVHGNFCRMCNALRLGSECVTDTGWLFHRFGEEGAQMFKNVYSLYSAFFTQPAFYSQSAACILHSVCILPLVRSLQSAVCVLHWPIINYLNRRTRSAWY